MWDEYYFFEPILDKIARKWYLNFKGRFSLQELKSEAVDVYVDISRSSYQDKPRSEFGRLLYRSCYHKMIDFVRSNRFMVCIDDVQIQINAKEFRDVYLQFWVNSVRKRMSEDAVAVLDMVTEEVELLERAHKERKKNAKYKTDFCKEDVKYHFTREEGWRGIRADKACQEVSEFFLEFA